MAKPKQNLLAKALESTQEIAPEILEKIIPSKTVETPKTPPKKGRGISALIS